MKHILERRGWAVVPAPQWASQAVVPASQTWAYQWQETLSMLRVDLAFDVGANTGQWYQRFREAGFTCPVVSFEPDPRALTKLRDLADELHDPNWTIEPYALGRESTSEAEFFLWPMTSGSSSLKSVSDFGGEFTGYTADSLPRTTVPVRRFDDAYHIEDLSPHRPLLKIDVQGYESEVLGGMRPDIIQAFVAIEIEIPLVDVYADSGSFIEIYSSIADLGFVPYTIQSERWHGEGYGAADCDVLMVNTRETRAR